MVEPSEAESGDAQTSGWPDSAEDLTHTADWYGSPDTRLRWMADTADTLEVGIGITLVVPGGTISGNVISAQRFFKSTAEQFRAGIEGNDEHGLGETLAESFFDKAAEQIEEDVKEKSEAFDKGERKEPRWPMVRHIHLEDARFSVPGQNHIKLELTRVLLSQVVAWSIGAKWWGEG
jgi:histone acetyltransferase (RNA polymerase elongator complex component)